jgi:hypothetical protein
MSLLKEIAEPFIHEPLLPPLEIGEIRSRARKRRMKRRLLYAGSPLLVGLLMLGLLTAVSNSNTSPDMRFTSFATPGPPHLLDSEISFGYLPSGFQLISDERINKGTRPVSYQRTIVFQGGTSASPEQIVLGIQQSASEAIQSRVPSPNSSESGSFTSVRGHKAIEVNFYDHVYGHVSYTYFHGKRQEVITCSGPANAPISQVDPVCRGGWSTNKSQPGPPPSVSPILTNTYPRISLAWIERPGVMFSLSGSGMTLSTLKEIANGINYNSTIGNCIVKGKPLYSGPCAPGVVGSPPVNSPLVPAGGTELASGTIAGRAWALSAHMQPGNVWVDLGYSGQGGIGSWFSVSNASPTISVNTRNDGQRFLFGIVPSSVSSFAAKPQGHPTIHSNVLPARLDGWSFFVMPLGKVTGVCNAVCSSPLHITFYSGSKIVYSSNWSQDSTGSGLQIP